MNVMNVNSLARRRLYQFSLRSFLLLVTLVCVGVGYWVHRSKAWIRQRHEALENRLCYDFSDSACTTAPGGLWMFGERGVITILCSQENAEMAGRLFPESVISPMLGPASLEK